MHVRGCTALGGNCKTSLARRSRFLNNFGSLDANDLVP